MVDAISSIGAVGSSASGGFAFANASSSESSETLAQVQAPAVSPRLRVDFDSGALVLEFLSDNGAVTSQTPSAVALAYLRAGLTADGLRKEDQTSQPSGQSAPAIHQA